MNELSISAPSVGQKVSLSRHEKNVKDVLKPLKAPVANQIKRHGKMEEI